MILGIALLVVGPQKLPDIAKAIGKGFREFRKASDSVKESLTNFEEELPVPGEKGISIDKLKGVPSDPGTNTPEEKKGDNRDPQTAES